MTYYFAAYVLFWAALFGYLVALTLRQGRLNARAARLVERLSRSGGESDGSPGGAP